MIDASSHRRPSAVPIRRLATTLLLSALLGMVVAAPASASSAAPLAGGTQQVTPAASATSATMTSQFLTLLNRDRASAGLRPLRVWSALTSLATGQATAMATAGAGEGNLAPMLNRFTTTWLGWGEISGGSSYAWGSPAVSNLYGLFRGSGVHHAIMFSSRFNYVGLAFVRRSNGSTVVFGAFVEDLDHTPAIARNGSLTRIGATSLHFTWSGADPLLQTHTAGLRGFNVQYRVDGGTWHRIRTMTTRTWLGMSNRAHRHYYSFRVQASDRRGNLSAWTAVKRIWVP